MEGTNSKGLREPLLKQKRFLSGIAQITPPFPQFRQLVLLFLDVKILDLDSHLGGGEGDILKLKKQLKVQYIGILKK